MKHLLLFLLLFTITANLFACDSTRTLVIRLQGNQDQCGQCIVIRGFAKEMAQALTASVKTVINAVEDVVHALTVHRAIPSAAIRVIHSVVVTAPSVAAPGDLPTTPCPPNAAPLIFGNSCRFEN